MFPTISISRSIVVVFFDFADLHTSVGNIERKFSIDVRARAIMAS